MAFYRVKEACLLHGKMAVRERLNLAEVDARFDAAFENTAIAYADQLKVVIASPRQWPQGFGTTYRQNGEVVTGSYRNIYDTGNLANSQRVTIRRHSATYTWDGDGETPPVVVHEGATLRNGHRIPARRFTRVAANEAQLGRRFVGTFRGVE